MKSRRLRELSRLEPEPAAASSPAGGRQNGESAAMAVRLVRYPAASQLALGMARPEWLTESGSIRPPTADDYRAALEHCRAMGLSIVEEEAADTASANVWATVEYRGTRVLIDGRRQIRDGLS